MPLPQGRYRSWEKVETPGPRKGEEGKWPIRGGSIQDFVHSPAAFPEHPEYFLLLNASLTWLALGHLHEISTIETRSSADEAAHRESHVQDHRPWPQLSRWRWSGARMWGEAIARVVCIYAAETISSTRASRALPGGSGPSPSAAVSLPLG